MTKLVYDFAEGSRDMVDLLGGKGADLAEMTRLGLPVPPGFTVTTDACRAYLADGELPAGLARQVEGHLDALEHTTGRRLGDPGDPLLVSVRSGGKFSMPGMMDTVLNVGLNDESVVGLAEQSGDGRFAWDSYRRLLQMFGRTVLGLDGRAFEQILDDAKHERGTREDLELDEEALRAVAGDFQVLIEKPTGSPFPQDPRVQLDLAMRAVFDSWHGERARLYRRQERIRPDSGRPSTSAPWCSATSGWVPVPASRSPATRSAEPPGSTGTTCRTRRARTSSPGYGTRCPWRTWRPWTRRRTTAS